MDTSWVGYAWLKENFDLPVTQRLTTLSQIGSDRKSRVEGNTRYEFYRSSARPEDTPEAHLAFALKHEGVHLELLSHAFAKIDKAALTRWIAAEPTGQYAGKAGFLYEWLTNETLLVAGVGGSDCDSLDSSQVVTAETPSKEIKPQDQ